MNGFNWSKTLAPVCVVPVLLLTTLTADSEAQIVPGTGTLHNTDKFENEKWGYVFNSPKSSKEEDETIRYPLGGSTNGRWIESPKRGQPDVIKRVATPEGGLEGSEGALLLQTRDTGIPGRPMGKQCQDDFILKARPLSIGYQPNYVVRVYLPEWSEWEQRHGVSFGIRAGMQGPQETWEDAGFARRLFGQKQKTRHQAGTVLSGLFHPVQSGLGAESRTARDHPHPRQRERTGHGVAEDHADRLVDLRHVDHFRRPLPLLRQARRREPDGGGLHYVHPALLDPRQRVQHDLLQRLQRGQRPVLVNALDHR